MVKKQFFEAKQNHKEKSNFGEYIRGENYPMCRQAVKGSLSDLIRLILNSQHLPREVTIRYLRV